MAAHLLLLGPHADRLSQLPTHNMRSSHYGTQEHACPAATCDRIASTLSQ